MRIWLAFIALSVALPSRADIISGGLIGYWNGNGNAQDTSPTANNGTFTGNYTGGIFGQAFQLGTGAVNVADHAAYPSGGNFSIGFWFNGSGGALGFLGQDDGPGSLPKWGVLYNYSVANAFQFHLNGSGSAFINSSTQSIPVGWNQFTLVKSGTAYSFYLNGANIGNASNNTPFPNPVAALSFGYLEPALTYGGLMDDVVLYNRALAPTEVAVLANPVPSIVPEPGTGTLAVAAAFTLLGVHWATRRHIR